MRITHNKGFTLLEFVIAITILAIVAAVVLVPLRSWRTTQILVEEVGSIAAALEEARSKTLGSEGGTAYGVHFESDRVTLFQGKTFAPGAIGNKTHVLSPAVSLTAINLEGGGVDTVFKRLSGETDAYGFLTVSLTADLLENRQITILKTGALQISK